MITKKTAFSCPDPTISTRLQYELYLRIDNPML